MFKKVIVLVLFVYAQSGSAQASRCLGNTSNRELLNELSRRLLIPPLPEPSEKIEMRASFTCSSSTQVVMDLVNLNSGESSQTVVPMVGWDSCNQAASTLNEKIGSDNSIGKIFAICGGNSTLYKILISNIGKVNVTKTAMISLESCFSAADKFNNVN